MSRWSKAQGTRAIKNSQGRSAGCAGTNGDDFRRAVSRILSAPTESGERIICLSSQYPKPVPQNGTRSGPPLGFLFGLAPDGVFRALAVTCQAVGFYPTFSPLPRPCGRGGLFSVALSVEMP